MTLPAGEVVQSNRCAYFLRPRGCRKGGECTYCHVHAVTVMEDHARAPKMEGKKERREAIRQRETDPVAMARKDTYAVATRTVRQDLEHIYRHGEIIHTESGKSAVIGIWAVHRMLEDALPAAKHVAETFNITEESVGVWLGKDKMHTSHYEQPVPGHQALYDGLAWNLVAVPDNFPDVDIVIVCECDVAFSETAQGKLCELIDLIADSPMTLLGFYPNKVSKGRSGKYSGLATGDRWAAYGTQCWSIQGSAIPLLCTTMQREPPDDVDLWFIGRNPWGDGLSFLSHSIAGQRGGRTSECSRPASGGVAKLTQDGLISNYSWQDVHLLSFEGRHALREDVWKAHLQRHKVPRSRWTPASMAA